MKIYDSCWNSNVRVPASEEASGLVQELVDYTRLISKGKRLYEPLLEPLKEK